MKKILPSLFLLVFFYSCENSNSTASKLVEQPLPAESPVEIADDNFIAKDEEIRKFKRPIELQKPLAYSQLQKLIHRADVRMQVEDYVKTSEIINNKLKNYQAYITDGTEERAGENLENTLQIRVDNNKFNLLLDELLKESIYLERKNITVEDVTEEYIDHETCLKTKRKVEQRYLDLLGKARNIKDILAIEAQLSTIREEIEAKQARLKYLDHQVSYSTIHLNYYEKIVVASAPGNSFLSRVAASVNTGWNSFITALVTLISLLPLFLIGLVAAIWIIKFYKKKHPVSL